MLGRTVWVPKGIDNDSVGASGYERYGGNPGFYVSGACPRLEGNFGENLDFCTLKETLVRINIDVDQCLAWVDQDPKIGFAGAGP